MGQLKAKRSESLGRNLVEDVGGGRQGPPGPRQHKMDTLKCSDINLEFIDQDISTIPLSS